jgi:energy-coupling factor transport system ATP-binding protein
LNILLEKLNFSFDATPGESTQLVLKELSLQLQSGECVALVGASGAGKTTLAQVLNGLLEPLSGEMLIDGKSLKYNPRELRELRSKVGLVFQFPETQIFESTVFDEVAFAARQWGNPDADVAENVDRVLTSVGLDPESFINRNPLRLSGGEARLVSIASLLVANPEWLILDEPTLGLDIAHKRCVTRLINDRKEEAKGVLLITHDLDMVLELCPRTMVLQHGSLVYDGSTSNLLKSKELCDKFMLKTPGLLRFLETLKMSDEPISESKLLGMSIDELLAWIQLQSPEVKTQMCSNLKHFDQDFNHYRPS